MTYIVVIASNKCRCLGKAYWSVQNEVFYRTGIFSLAGGGFCVFKKGIPGGPGFMEVCG